MAAKNTPASETRTTEEAMRGKEADDLRVRRVTIEGGPVDTVTVRSVRGGCILAFSKLPGREFGPYLFDEAVRDLQISALLAPLAARNLVMEAVASGSATTTTG